MKLGNLGVLRCGGGGWGGGQIFFPVTNLVGVVVACVWGGGLDREREYDLHKINSSKE